jgi:hypothetical protein
MGKKVSRTRWVLERAKRVSRRIRAARWALVGRRERALMSLWWVWWTATRGCCGFVLRDARFGLGLTGRGFCV